MDEGLDAGIETGVAESVDVGAGSELPAIESMEAGFEPSISEQHLTELQNEADALEIRPLEDGPELGDDFNDGVCELIGPTYRDDVKDNPEFFDESGELRWPLDGGFVGSPDEITLEPGIFIDRYGSEDGRFTALAGTPYENRSLPFVEGCQEYNVYEVVKPIEGVLQGETGGAFNQPGGGMQQRLPEPVEYYVENGHLRRH